MKAPAALLLFLALAACQRGAAPAPDRGDAGPALERAALATGLVADPDKLDPTGTFGSDTDAICILPIASGGYRIGASVDLGEDQQCVGRGTARGRGTLAVDLGADCRFSATVDGDRLSFPAKLPTSCQRTCVGRASLDAVVGDRLGTTAAEASRTRGADGKLLCPG